MGWKNMKNRARIRPKMIRVFSPNSDHFHRGITQPRASGGTSYTKCTDYAELLNKVLSLTSYSIMSSPADGQYVTIIILMTAMIKWRNNRKKTQCPPLAFENETHFTGATV